MIHKLRQPSRRLPITLRRDRRTSADRLWRNDHRQDKLRRIWHGVRTTPTHDSAIWLALTRTYLTSTRRSLNVHSVHGPVVNPFQHPSSAVEWHARERRSAGGSSGGSAAAVAAGMCDA